MRRENRFKGWALYVLDCDIAPGATGSVVNTVTVAVPGGITDPVPSNNMASESAPVPVLLQSFSIE